MQGLIDVVDEIASISDYKCALKKQYCNLSRRLKLLIPMFEESRESGAPIGEDNFKALALLKEALHSARDMLIFGSEGSVIYIVSFSFAATATIAFLHAPWIAPST